MRFTKNEETGLENLPRIDACKKESNPVNIWSNLYSTYRINIIIIVILINIYNNNKLQYEEVFTAAGDVMNHALDVLNDPDFEEKKGGWKVRITHPFISFLLFEYAS